MMMHVAIPGVLRQHRVSGSLLELGILARPAIDRMSKQVFSRVRDAERRGRAWTHDLVSRATEHGARGVRPLERCESGAP